MSGDIKMMSNTTMYKLIALALAVPTISFFSAWKKEHRIQEAFANEKDVTLSAIKIGRMKDATFLLNVDDNPETYEYIGYMSQATIRQSLIGVSKPGKEWLKNYKMHVKKESGSIR